MEKENNTPKPKMLTTKTDSKKNIWIEKRMSRMKNKTLKMVMNKALKRNSFSPPEKLIKTFKPKIELLNL